MVDLQYTLGERFTKCRYQQYAMVVQSSLDQGTEVYNCPGHIWMRFHGCFVVYILLFVVYSFSFVGWCLDVLLISVYAKPNVIQLYTCT